jgi:TolB-like protein/cytochrome c-type biogenesis protein CcmH/NrfG
LPCAFQLTRIKVECCRDERFVKARRVNPKNFFAELKRRNVYKVAIAYGAVAWLLLQAASILFPTFEAPPWTMKVFLAVTALGFPIALILAWAFELTPEGIKRTDEIEPGRRSRNRAWIYVVVIAGAISVGLFFLGRYTAPTKLSGSANAAAKSIAVLPFENLSEDKANAYFADGIQEEILTRLAQIADLKVISRTSTQRYQSKPANLSEIAKQLGVANILEGSVQKAGDLVRVNVKLIQADSDSHLWADTYDRKLTDIFGVESEIAKAIAERLQAKLTGREQQALAVKPTNNSEAYDAYLRGLAFEAHFRSGNVLPNAAKAAGFYERSVQLDPAFALAWGRLARVESLLYFNRVTAAREAAARALKVAQELQPNSPETILAQGYYQYYVLEDYELAKATFVLVRNVLPGSSDVPAALALIARRQGRWDESIGYWEQALALDPRNSGWLTLLAQTYSMLRQFSAALKMYDRALDIEPNDPNVIAAKAGIHQAEGDLEQAGKLLAGVDAHTASFGAFRTKIIQLRLERQHDEAIRLLEIRLAEFHEVSGLERDFDQLSLAFAHRFAGDVAAAKTTAEEAQRRLETLWNKDSNAPSTSSALGSAVSAACAALGQKDAALKYAERAVMLLPSSKDAVGGPDREEILAFVEATVGETGRAIPRLQRLLEIPYLSFLDGAPLTPALLRLDPIWDPLRSDPAFQKLCEEKKP